MLKGKARATQNWLPNQVVYGMDTSDSDPKNWKPFGSAVDAEPTPAQEPRAARASKADLLEQ